MNSSFEALKESVNVRKKLNQGAWEFDFFSENFSWSSEMYDLLHFNPAMLYSKQGQVCDLFSEDESTKLNAWFIQLKSGVEIKSLDVEFYNERTGHKFYRWTAGIFCDAFNKPVRAVGTMQDITLYKGVEENLNQYKYFFYKSNDLNCIANVHGFFEKVNHKFTELLGYSEIDLVENSFLNFIHPDDIASTLQEIEKLKGGAITINFCNRYRKKDGDYVWLEWISTPDTQSGKLYAIARDISEHIHHEASLLEINNALEAKVVDRTKEIDLRNKYYQFLIQNSNNAIITVDEAGNITYQSHVVEKITGYNESELLKNSLIFLDENHNEFLLQLINLKGNEGGVVSILYKIKHKNGFYRWIEGSITNRMRTKPIGAFIFNFSDVTARRESELEVSLSESKLKKAQEIANFGTFELSISTGQMLWSEVACKIHGFPMSETQQSFEIWVSLIHPDDLNFVMANIKLAQETIKPITFSYRIVIKNKIIRYVQLGCFFELDDAGQILNINGILNDITEEKHAEKELLLNEMFTRHVLDSLTSQIAVIDKTGLVKETNKAWDEFRFVHGETLLYRTESGTNFIEMCDREKYANEEAVIKAKEGINEVLKGRVEEFSSEYQIELMGVVRWFQMRITKFKQDKSMLVLAHDEITMRKLAEMETKKTAVDLVHRNKDLEQFAYMVSHNLRAPVANIIGLSDIIIQNHLNEDSLKDATKGLCKSANKLDDVIKDLNFILQVRGQLSEKKETVNLTKLIKDIEISLSTLFKDLNLSIKLDFKAVDKLVSVKGYVHSIFYNLIINSIKYRKPDLKPFIDIKSEKHAQSIVIRFRDNGLGFNMKRDGNNIFGLYKRFNTEIDGKGIGLYMVKLQVESLGGTIRLESELGKGAEFIIEFKN